MDYLSEAPEIVRSFLSYHETVKGHSKQTVNEYFLDLRTFFRYMKILKNVVPRDTPLEEIPIDDVTLDFAASITITDVYDYLGFLSRDREVSHQSKNSAHGLNSASRARKVATIRSFYKYLTLKAPVKLQFNPVQDLDSPKIMKSLPRYLNESESIRLLSNVKGRHHERDFCIITIFLNCGLRISELVGLDIGDIHEDHLRVLGKGNKERIVYINDACIDAINAYLAIRTSASANTRAFFLSSRGQRISTSMVHALVKKHLSAAGLDSTKYSSHKLRHTAATLMLHNGVDVRTLQELLGHEHLNTTEIYTHVENDSLREAASLSPLSDFKLEDKPENEK